MKLVRAIRNGQIKTRKDAKPEKARFYDIWATSATDTARRHIPEAMNMPAPKIALPGASQHGSGRVCYDCCSCSNVVNLERASSQVTTSRTTRRPNTSGPTKSGGSGRRWTRRSACGSFPRRRMWERKGSFREILRDGLS